MMMAFRSDRWLHFNRIDKVMVKQKWIFWKRLKANLRVYTISRISSKDKVALRGLMSPYYNCKPEGYAALFEQFSLNDRFMEDTQYYYDFSYIARVARWRKYLAANKVS